MGKVQRPKRSAGRFGSFSQAFNFLNADLGPSSQTAVNLSWRAALSNLYSQSSHAKSKTSAYIQNWLFPIQPEEPEVIPTYTDTAFLKRVGKAGFSELLEQVLRMQAITHLNTTDVNRLFRKLLQACLEDRQPLCRIQQTIDAFFAHMDHKNPGHHFTHRELSNLCKAHTKANPAAWAEPDLAIIKRSVDAMLRDKLSIHGSIENGLARNEITGKLEPQFDFRTGRQFKANTNPFATLEEEVNSFVQFELPRIHWLLSGELEACLQPAIRRLNPAQMAEIYTNLAACVQQMHPKLKMRFSASDRATPEYQILRNRIAGLKMALQESAQVCYEQAVRKDDCLDERRWVKDEFKWPDFKPTVKGAVKATNVVLGAVIQLAKTGVCYAKEHPIETSVGLLFLMAKGVKGQGSLPTKFLDLHVGDTFQIAMNEDFECLKRTSAASSLICPEDSLFVLNVGAQGYFERTLSFPAYDPNIPGFTAVITPDLRFGYSANYATLYYNCTTGWQIPAQTNCPLRSPPGDSRFYHVFIHDRHPRLDNGTDTTHQGLVRGVRPIVASSSSFSGAFTDKPIIEEDGDTLKFVTELDVDGTGQERAAPDWVFTDSQTGTVSGTRPLNAEGRFWFEQTVSTPFNGKVVKGPDFQLGTHYSNTSYRSYIEFPNDAPRTNIPLPEHFVAHSFEKLVIPASKSVIAIEPNGNEIEISLVPGTTASYPAGMVYNNIAQVVEWLPDPTQRGTYRFRLKIQDIPGALCAATTGCEPASALSVETNEVTVDHVNLAPVWLQTLLPSRGFIDSDLGFQMDPEASYDPDMIDPPTFSIRRIDTGPDLVNAPVIDPDTGDVSWVPAKGTITDYDYQFMIRRTDPEGAYAETRWTAGPKDRAEDIKAGLKSTIATVNTGQAFDVTYPNPWHDRDWSPTQEQTFIEGIQVSVPDLPAGSLVVELNPDSTSSNDVFRISGNIPHGYGGLLEITFSHAEARSDVTTTINGINQAPQAKFNPPTLPEAQVRKSYCQALKATDYFEETDQANYEFTVIPGSSWVTYNGSHLCHEAPDGTSGQTVATRLIYKDLNAAGEALPPYGLTAQHDISLKVKNAGPIQAEPLEFKASEAGEPWSQSKVGLCTHDDGIYAQNLRTHFPILPDGIEQDDTHIYTAAVPPNIQGTFQASATCIDPTGLSTTVHGHINFPHSAATVSTPPAVTVYVNPASPDPERTLTWGSSAEAKVAEAAGTPLDFEINSPDGTAVTVSLAPGQGSAVNRIVSTEGKNINFNVQAGDNQGAYPNIRFQAKTAAGLITPFEVVFACPDSPMALSTPAEAFFDIKAPGTIQPLDAVSASDTDDVITWSADIPPELAGIVTRVGDNLSVFPPDGAPAGSWDIPITYRTAQQPEGVLKLHRVTIRDRMATLDGDSTETFAHGEPVVFGKKTCTDPDGHTTSVDYEFTGNPFVSFAANCLESDTQITCHNLRPDTYHLEATCTTNYGPQPQDTATTHFIVQPKPAKSNTEKAQEIGVKYGIGVGSFLLISSGAYLAVRRAQAKNKRRRTLDRRAPAMNTKANELLRAWLFRKAQQAHPTSSLSAALLPTRQAARSLSSPRRSRTSQGEASFAGFGSARSSAHRLSLASAASNASAVESKAQVSLPGWMPSTDSDSWPSDDSSFNSSDRSLPTSTEASPPQHFRSPSALPALALAQADSIRSMASSGATWTPSRQDPATYFRGLNLEALEQWPSLDLANHILSFIADLSDDKFCLSAAHAFFKAYLHSLDKDPALDTSNAKGSTLRPMGKLEAEKKATKHLGALKLTDLINTVLKQLKSQISEDVTTKPPKAPTIFNQRAMTKRQGAHTPNVSPKTNYLSRWLQMLTEAQRRLKSTRVVGQKTLPPACHHRLLSRCALHRARDKIKPIFPQQTTQRKTRQTAVAALNLRAATRILKAQQVARMQARCLRSAAYRRSEHPHLDAVALEATQRALLTRLYKASMNDDQAKGWTLLFSACANALRKREADFALVTPQTCEPYVLFASSLREAAAEDLPALEASVRLALAVNRRRPLWSYLPLSDTLRQYWNPKPPKRADILDRLEWKANIVDSDDDRGPTNYWLLMTLLDVIKQNSDIEKTNVTDTLALALAQLPTFIKAHFNLPQIDSDAPKIDSRFVATVVHRQVIDQIITFIKALRVKTDITVDREKLAQQTAEIIRVLLNNKSILLDDRHALHTDLNQYQRQLERSFPALHKALKPVLEAAVIAENSFQMAFQRFGFEMHVNPYSLANRAKAGAGAGRAIRVTDLRAAGERRPSVGRPALVMAEHHGTGGERTSARAPSAPSAPNASMNPLSGLPVV